MNTVTMLQVSTIVPADVQKGFVPVVASTRAKKDGPAIPEDQKRRVVLIPEFHPAVSSKYAVMLTSMLYEVAREVLADQWAKNPSIVEVPAALFTEDAILSFASLKTEGTRLTGERITEWFKLPNISEALSKRQNPERTKGVLLSAAAPNMLIRNIEQCDALLGILKVAEDDDTTANQIRARIQKIRAELSQNAEAL